MSPFRHDEDQPCDDYKIAFSDSQSHHTKSIMKLTPIVSACVLQHHHSTYLRSDPHSAADGHDPVLTDRDTKSPWYQFGPQSSRLRTTFAIVPFRAGTWTSCRGFCASTSSTVGSPTSQTITREEHTTKRSNNESLTLL